MRVDALAHRKLVRQNGTYECALSGGCLEPAVAEAAERVIASGEAVTATYDLAEDSIWGLGIGCSGGSQSTFGCRLVPVFAESARYPN